MVHKQFKKQHFALVGACAVLLFIVIFMRNGFSLGRESGSKEDTKAETLTYEQAKAQVESGESTEAGDDLIAENDALLALLDPASAAAGSVLGATTEQLKNFPSAEEIFSEAELAKINLETIPSEDPMALERYSQDLLAVEAHYNVIDLIASLNSTEESVLKGSVERSNKLVGSLAKIKVPTPLVEYHKMKMVYYVTLSNVAQAFLAPEGSANLPVQSQLLFSLTDKMERIKVDIKEKYNFDL